MTEIISADYYKSNIKEIELERFLNTVNHYIKDGVFSFELWGYKEHSILVKGLEIIKEKGWGISESHIWYSYSWRINVKIKS